MRYVNRAYSRTALAGLYRAARVGLVTPLRDGMNLVAKEYVAAQDPDDPGVLILSRFAGAADEFREALLVNPYDPDAVAAAIARAMAMPKDERKKRHAELYAALLRNDISKWGDKFLKALGPQDRKGAQALRDFVAAPVTGRRQLAQRARQQHDNKPQPQFPCGIARDGSVLGARHQLEAVHRRQPQHDQHQRQLGAQHAQIGRGGTPLPVFVPPRRIEAALISPVITSSSTATMAQSENSDRAGRMLGSLRRNSAASTASPPIQKPPASRCTRIQGRADER